MLHLKAASDAKVTPSKAICSSQSCAGPSEVVKTETEAETTCETALVIAVPSVMLFLGLLLLVSPLPVLATLHLAALVRPLGPTPLPHLTVAPQLVAPIIIAIQDST